MRVLIVGAGGHGQVVADILLGRMRANGVDLRPVGFVDDDPRLHHQVLLGLPVLGGVADLAGLEHDGVVVAIGSNEVRRRLCERLRAGGERLVSAVHPSALVGLGVEIQPGAMLCAGVVVSTGARIGTGAILNTACTVDHHNRIGDYAHVAPGAHLGGDVVIGAGTLIGIGAAVLSQRQIGDWCVVGAGSVVTRDIPDGRKVVGVPARSVPLQGPPLSLSLSLSLQDPVGQDSVGQGPGRR
jgi:sugar O-acyltransferase (sialic acid O-acetyltransferase NeuD family)